MFDLGQAAVETAGSFPMRVEVSLPGWLDNGDIAYRLDYEDATRLRQYAGSRWAGRPSQLIAARLSSRFAGGAARCTLRLELDEFAQHFSAAGSSTQQVSGRWTIAGAGGERLATAALRRSEPAGADASSGVKAAARLVEGLADELKAAAGKLPACGA
jgi:uncharacterized lipoprotein YmbA